MIDARTRVGALVAAAFCLGLGACAAQVPSSLGATDAAMAGIAASAAGDATAPPVATTDPALTVTEATTTPAPTTAPPTTATRSPSPTVEPTTTSGPTTTSTTLISTSTTVLPAPEAFGDGTHIVGADIFPGRYEALVPTDGCSWQRLSGLSGEFRDVLADGNPRHRAIVDILSDDAAMVTQGCGSWTEYRPFEDPLTEFGAGTWAIGGQIQPGTYSAPGGEGCFWAIVTSFDGAQTSILAIARPGPETIEVALTANDTGFVSDYCGVFSLTG